MGKVRELRKLARSLGAGRRNAEGLRLFEREVIGLRVNLEKVFSVGEQLPPRKRLRKANMLCRMAEIVLSLRRDPAISETFNGVLGSLERALEKVEEQRERFIAVNPQLQRKRRN